MIGKEFVISFLRHYSDSGDFVIHKDMTSSVEFAMKIAELLTEEKKKIQTYDGFTVIKNDFHDYTTQYKLV